MLPSTLMAIDGFPTIADLRASGDQRIYPIAMTKAAVDGATTTHSGLTMRMRSKSSECWYIHDGLVGFPNVGTGWWGS
jgi:hypothetical protein